MAQAEGHLSLNAKRPAFAGRKGKLVALLYSGADPLMQLLLRRGADLARSLLAILEQHQGRNGHDAVLTGGLWILVNVQLDDFHLVPELTGDFLERGPYHAARAAPFGPEIHDHRFGRF